jgi:hypothetical protein
MTVEEFLKTIPKEDRDEMAAFYYSRVPYRFIPKGTTDRDTSPCEPQLSVLFPARSV